MVKLNNIKKEGNILSADVTIVEMTPRTFEVAIDTVSKKIVKNTLGIVDMHVTMAAAKLIKLSMESGEKLPKSAESVWY